MHRVGDCRRVLKRLRCSSCRAGWARDLEPQCRRRFDKFGSKQCLAVPSGAVAGARVALAPCDGPDASTAWELQRNGQIKLGSSNMCLSQSGPAPGNADLAASSSVIASSTLDPAHGAALAVDGLDSSFWASKLDAVSPVTLTVELDEPAPGGGS